MGVVIFSAIPSNTPVTISGFVSIVQVTTIGSGATMTFVTAVTFLPLLQSGTASTISFCGNVGNQFVLNTFTNVNFTRPELRLDHCSIDRVRTPANTANTSVARRYAAAMNCSGSLSNSSLQAFEQT